MHLETRSSATGSCNRRKLVKVCDSVSWRVGDETCVNMCECHREPTNDIVLILAVRFLDLSRPWYLLM